MREKILGMNKSEAIKATRHGAIAALVAAAISGFVFVVAILTNAEGMLAQWNDPAFIIDIVLVLACAYGMYRKSRTAALLMFFYYLADRIIIAIETEVSIGVIVTIVFMYFFGRAIQGAFVYHKLLAEENPEYKSTTKWAYILGIPSILVVTFLLGFALLSTIGVLPSTKVQTADEMRTDDMTTLLENGIINSEDKIEYFYATGFASVLEGGNILTSDRVIHYYTDENNELFIYEIPVNEITEVSLQSQGGIIDESVYLVSTNDPHRWIMLYLSDEQKRDVKFARAIRSKIGR